MSYYVGALITGAVMGPAVGGLLAVNFGFPAPFFFYALVTFAALGLIQVFLHEAP